MKNLNWPQVVALTVALFVVGALAWRGVDTTAIVGLALALLGGVLVGQQSQIKDQTNGQHSTLVELIKRQNEIIARSYPVPVPPAAEDPVPPPDGTVYPVDQLGDRS